MKKKEKDIITLYGILYERLPVTDILRFVIVGLLVYRSESEIPTFLEGLPLVSLYSIYRDLSFYNFIFLSQMLISKEFLKPQEPNDHSLSL